MYRIKITNYQDKQAYYQACVGFWGSDINIPKAYLEGTWSDIIKRVRHTGAKQTKDSRFYCKCDAIKVMYSLDICCQRGGYFLKGKHGSDVQCLIAEVVKV